VRGKNRTSRSIRVFGVKLEPSDTGSLIAQFSFRGSKRSLSSGRDSNETHFASICKAFPAWRVTGL